MNGSTITAIATPIGNGGIGIIKISGQNALSIAYSIFQSSKPSPNNKANVDSAFFKSHHIYHGNIVDFDKKKVIDEVLLLIMLAPKSYTKENIVEIHAHSSPIVLKIILDLVIQKGARLAKPGEFTKRAFLNGRIDLTQAEAVIDTINAKSEQSLKIAVGQMQGDFKICIEQITNLLINILSEIEAAIDFPDDVGEIINTEKTASILKNDIINRLTALINQYSTGHIIREGLKIVIIGSPNVGKSSILNRLVRKKRAIVTSVPGTTRDFIEESINICGIASVIIDTAGLQETDDPVELVGIKNAYEYIDNSDLILYVVDKSNHNLCENNNKIYEKIKNKKVILVFNKSDLIEDNHRIEIRDCWNKFPSISISALLNKGFNNLKNLIVKVVSDEQISSINTFVPNLRHKIALEKSLDAALTAVNAIQKQEPFELIAIDIKYSIDFLDEIVGKVVKEDIIDNIFSRFCIGK